MQHSELALLEKFVFQACELQLSNIEADLESKAYFAHCFQIGTHLVRFRKAKIAPTKIGQFVTIWKRNEKGVTEPFHINDDINFYIIATRKEAEIGIFIFLKTVLQAYKILSGETQERKRGIRLYPTWDLTQSKKAQKSTLGN